MRTIILLTILAVLPISCRFYLYRELASTDEALQAIQKIEDKYQLARKNRDIELYLSIFDKDIKFESCGITLTYADFEKEERLHPFYERKNSGDMKPLNAVIEGEYLKFEIVPENGSGEKVLFTAIKRGEDFKLFSVKIEGQKCGSRRRYLQEDAGEYIF